MTNNIKGLTSEEVKRSFDLYGDNRLQKEKTKGLLRRFFENLCDPIIRILLIALTVQVVFTFNNCNYVEIFGIVAAILLSAVVSTLSEHKSEKAFEKLDLESNESYVCVLRDGVINSIKISQLVVGDVVFLNSGEKIQADGIIIEGKIGVDQSALNGESNECIKTVGVDHDWELSSKCKVFRGSVITSGKAVMRVLRIGSSTYYGMVAKDVQTETRVSPLKLRLEKFAKQISKIGYFVASFVGISYLFNCIIVDNGFSVRSILAFCREDGALFSCFLHALTLMITMIVVAAPEGLPMMITVILSSNMKRMISDNVLVKKLVGIETAGSMNILFTDKTGTLTKGHPECNKVITATGCFTTIEALRKNGIIYEYLCLSAKYNTEVDGGENAISGGNATDRAIYDFFKCEGVKSTEVIEKTAFTSERKYSSVTFKNRKKLIKGAAEMILAASKYTFDQKGNKVLFSEQSVLNEYYNSVKRGERVIGVAMDDGMSDGYIFIALLVMKDKLRRGVEDAVAMVKKAGIQVVMVTGDGKETAEAIAEECGIYNSRAGHMVLTSNELKALSDDEIKTLLPRLRVISRALPQDKTRLVRLSQDLNLVVGMTGDGINDSPSLKLSDVGFAMGGGTDIAKSASDIVILDNSFTAIAKTVLYGRTIFKSIRKFITFQLIMNLAACGVSLIGQFIGIDTPITIIQMLWVNIIMDTLGGLAFAGEAPLKYYMFEKTKSREEPILSKDMLSQILFCGAYALTLCVVFLTSPLVRTIYGNLTDRFYTAFYALFIFTGIFICFTSRCERLWIFSNISKNKPFVLIMTIIIAIQILMIYFGGAVFRCVPLRFNELVFVVLLAFTVIPFDVLRRVIHKLK